MKKKIYLFLSIFVLFNLDINAQCVLQVDTIAHHYYNNITEQYLIIDEYKITNHTNEEYFTWVSSIPIKNKSNKELIWHYFKYTPGDFNFVQLMYEEFYDWNIIGLTFIKKISENESFSYFFVKNDSKSTFYQDRIVILSKKHLRQFLRPEIEIREKCFYKLPSVIILEK